LNEINDQDDHGNYEQEMDQAAPNVADEAEKPEHDQMTIIVQSMSIPFASVKLRRRIYSELDL
jgi:hypothetical protein